MTRNTIEATDLIGTADDRLAALEALSLSLDGRSASYVAGAGAGMARIVADARDELREAVGLLASAAPPPTDDAQPTPEKAA